jgi:ADP-dependent NAD(P)H-hydrate dehydratase
MEPPTEQSLHTPVIEITDALLRGLPLPRPDDKGDKEDRGRLLLIGGSPEMPGAIILAATAALRAGAGKTQIATCSSIAPFVACTLLEGRVFAMPETTSGGIAGGAAEAILERARHADALLVGPGMVDEQSTALLVSSLLSALEDVPMLLDAGALTSLSRARLDSTLVRNNVILTPHAEEMASLLQCEREQVSRNPVEAVSRVVDKFKANVLLKGAETLLGLPDGKLYRHRAANVGLATSGSGDTLAGLLGGLMARGATPAQAAIWAVYVHARAGERLAHRTGPLGFLARELLPEFPKLLTELEQERSH